MILNARRIMTFGVAVGTVIAAMLWNGSTDIDRGFLSASEARIGRPLTPMSYAGVARRTTRRAVVATGAVAAGAYVAAPYAAPACVQVVNAYGQIVTRC